MTIEIRELIIEARVIDSEHSSSQTDELYNSTDKLAEESRLIDLITRRVIEVLREDIRRLR